MPATPMRPVVFIPPSAFRIPHWRFPFAAFVLLMLGVSVYADTPPKIDKIRLGLPSGQGGGGGRMRMGAWAPVYVSVTASKEGNGQKQFKLVFDALDQEENPYRYTVPVQALAPEVNDVVIGYLRSPTQEFTVTLQTVDGKVLQGPVKHPRGPESDALRPTYPLFLAMGGSSLPNFKLALLTDTEAQATGDEASKQSKNYTRISKVSDMPDRWFGYDAVDVVVLTTDNDTFMQALTASSAAPRRKALAEWVRRGGTLVISVGRNHQLVNNLLVTMPLPEVDKMPLVPYEITGSVQRNVLTKPKEWGGVPFTVPPLGAKSKNGVEVAKLALRDEAEPAKPGAPIDLGPGTNVLVSERAAPEEKDNVERPLLVQSSCGLGRVLLIAFDVDGSPFNDWDGQIPFWKRLRKEAAPYFDPQKQKATEDRNLEVKDRGELGEEIQRKVDLFDDVPIVSFGWVALFILLYILVVGPLDYLVLKKVFKKLELTWVTFPTVVITISVSAYFIAYLLKGDDLRVNKIDLVEIDLHTPQAYGTSWFGVFSPRIQNYTVSVDPVFKTNVGGLETPKASTTVTLMENVTATPRAGSTSIFRQPYEYSEDAGGIERMPIPVWSTRTFTASWRTPLRADKLPFRADLTLSKTGVVTGKIINELPVDLQDVCLIYHGRWYKLPNNRPLTGKRDAAAAGDQFEVAELEMSDGIGRGQGMDSWFVDPILTGRRTLASNRNNNWNSGQVPLSSHMTMKTLLFYREGKNDTTALNSGWRTLNQAWRLTSGDRDHPSRDEVILVARTPYVTGKAKKINDESLVPLWNDQLPGTAEEVPPLTGYLSQETYIRVFIPVKKP